MIKTNINKVKKRIKIIINKLKDKIKMNFNNIIENYIFKIACLIFLFGLVFLFCVDSVNPINEIIRVVVDENEYISKMAIAISGFSITIISIFGVGYSYSIKLLKEKKHLKTFLKYIKKGVIVSIVNLIISVIIYLTKIESSKLINQSNFLKILLWLYVCLIIYMLLAFIRVVYIIFLMFSANISNIEELNEESIKKELREIKANLLEINQKISSINQTTIDKERLQKDKLKEERRRLMERDSKYNKND